MTRAKGGWRAANPDAVIVARPSRWSNPYAYRTHTGLARVPATNGDEWEYEGRISADGMRHDYFWPDGRVTEHHVRYMTREEIVETYWQALVTPTAQLRLFDRTARQWLTVEDARAELAGRDLACWCKLTDPCHADVLLEVANGPTW
jgi:hypothetical protein